MNTPDLQALIELSEKATAGPWDAEGFAISAHHVAGDSRLEYWVAERIGGDSRPEIASGRPKDNAAFIAALVNWFRANHSTLTAPTLPGAGGGDTLDARRYRWLRANACEGRMESRGPNPDFALNCDEPEWEWDAAIDAALPPQQGG